MSHSPRILISGFEPFGSHTSNISLEFLLWLKQQKTTFRYDSLVLPVVFTEAAETLSRELQREKPDFLVMLGLAGDRKNIQWERIAVNWICAGIADNKGQKPDGEKIDPQGKDGIFGALPPEGVSSSWSAGTYVCNDLFYRILNGGLIATDRATFIHLPGLDVENPETVYRSLLSIIEKIDSTLRRS